MNSQDLISIMIQSAARLPVWAWGVLFLICAAIFAHWISGGAGVPWFSKKTSRPALYLFASVGEPHLVKVGYTSRKTESRQVELERKLGGKLVLLRRIRMPHAWCAEQRAHRYIGAKGWRLDWSRGLGGEWYLVPGDAGVREVARLMEAAARDTERQARQRYSWHPLASITITDSRSMPR